MEFPSLVPRRFHEYYLKYVGISERAGLLGEDGRKNEASFLPSSPSTPRAHLFLHTSSSTHESAWVRGWEFPMPKHDSYAQNSTRVCTSISTARFQRQTRRLNWQTHRFKRKQTRKLVLMKAPGYEAGNFPCQNMTITPKIAPAFALLYQLHVSNGKRAV